MGVDFREFIGMYTDPNYLQHHGILGMKWGIRRYQNIDGSLTARGRARLNKIASKPHRVRKENRKAKRILKAESKRAAVLANEYKISAKEQYEEAKKAKKALNRTFIIGKKRRKARHVMNLSEEEYRRAMDNAEKYLLKSSSMRKKINEIKAGDYQAGRDFLIQTDWEFNPFPSKIKTIIQEENRERDYSMSKRSYH